MLPFQFGNCQRAIYIRCIAASQLETRFPSFTEMVVVGRKGKRKRIWGQRETKVTRTGSKGRLYQNIDFFRNLARVGQILRSRSESFAEAERAQSYVRVVGRYTPERAIGISRAQFVVLGGSH